MIRRPPRSTLFPYTTLSDLNSPGLHLPQQADPLANPQASGKPIVKNGKVIGYAVQIDPNAAPLPTIPYNPADFPDLEDYSILEPQVILVVKPGIIRFESSAPKQIAPGPPPAAKQVMVNGKVLTLVPYQGQVPVPNKPPVMLKKPMHSMQQQQRGKVVTEAQKELKCGLCSVTLPMRLMPMHMKMRHAPDSGLNMGRTPTTQAPKEPKEIEIVDSFEETKQKQIVTQTILPGMDALGKLPLPDFLQPVQSMEVSNDPLQDPLADPLAI